MQPRSFTGLEVAVVALLAAGVGYLGASAGGSPAPAPPPPVQASVVPGPTVGSAASGTPVPSVAAPGPATEDDLALARRGDLSALKRIELAPQRERSVAQAVALEAGHAELDRAEARALVADLRDDPALISDASSLRHARALARDPAVAPVLLAGLAELAHPLVADLLFEVAREEPAGTRVALLALDLLEGPTLRPKQSPALRVLTDLTAARDCWQRGEILSRALDQVDDRALSLLQPLARTTGCGPKQTDDCNPCLRSAPYEGKVDAALEAARSRPFRAPWGDQRGSAQQRKPVE